MNPAQLQEAFAALGFTRNGSTYTIDGINFTVYNGRVRYEERIDNQADIPESNLQATLTALSPTYRLLCELRSLLARTREDIAHLNKTAEFTKQTNRAIGRLHEEIARLKDELADAYGTIAALKSSSYAE